MAGNPPISIPPVTLPEQAPEPFPEPRFQLGQTVQWSCVPSQDFGHIIGIAFGTEGSVQATGYHYEIVLDPISPSFADRIMTDWGFEDDLALVTPNPIAGDRLEDSP